MKMGGREAKYGRAWPLKVLWLKLAAAWIVMILCVSAGGVWLFRVQVGEAMREAVKTIDVIGELKAAAISQERAERLADASYVSGSQPIRELLASLALDPSGGPKETVLMEFDRLKKCYGYSDIMLVGRSGEVILSLSGRKSLHPDIARAASLAHKSMRPVPVDFFADQHSGEPRLAVVSAVRGPDDSREEDHGSLVFETDPGRWLYPFIRRWPVASSSAETLLVRREGDYAMWLNDLRFMEGAALKLKKPLSDKRNPAVMAVSGRSGVFRGIDYRGKDVITFLLPVEGLPWHIVSKMDAEEVFNSIRLKISVYFALIAVVVALAFAVTVVARQRVIQYAALGEKESELSDYAARLEELNKELESFNYSVSHDLRAPLRSMDGFSKALMDDYWDKIDDKGKDYLGRVRAAAVNMSQLIDDMLMLSRINRIDIRLKTVDLSALARTIAADLKEEEPSRQARFIIGEGLTAAADEHLIMIAIRNLLENAFKFTGKNASARIEFGMTRKDADRVFFVSDDGAGFDARYYDKLFNPFQRLHSEKDFKGTGIGLVTVRRIIEKHGGRVWAESVVGKGATFYFTLGHRAFARH